MVFRLENQPTTTSWERDDEEKSVKKGKGKRNEFSVTGNNNSKASSQQANKVTEKEKKTKHAIATGTELTRRHWLWELKVSFTVPWLRRFRKLSLYFETGWREEKKLPIVIIIIIFVITILLFRHIFCFASAVRNWWFFLSARMRQLDRSFKRINSREINFSRFTFIFVASSSAHLSPYLLLLRVPNPTELNSSSVHSRET